MAMGCKELWGISSTCLIVYFPSCILVCATYLCFLDSFLWLPLRENVKTDQFDILPVLVYTRNKSGW